MGALLVDKGSVLINGNKVSSMKVLKHMGFMPQHDVVYNELSIWDNLKFFAGVQKIDKKTFHDCVEEILKVVVILFSVFVLDMQMEGSVWLAVLIMVSMAFVSVQIGALLSVFANNKL